MKTLSSIYIDIILRFCTELVLDPRVEALEIEGESFTTSTRCYMRKGIQYCWVLGLFSLPTSYEPGERSHQTNEVYKDSNKHNIDVYFFYVFKSLNITDFSCQLDLHLKIVTIAMRKWDPK